MIKYIQDELTPLTTKVLESGTAYATGTVLIIQDINWAVLGGIILFASRAAVDIPKAIDYWKERKRDASNRQGTR